MSEGPATDTLIDPDELQHLWTTVLNCAEIFSKTAFSTRTLTATVTLVGLITWCLGAVSFHAIDSGIYYGCAVVAALPILGMGFCTKILHDATGLPKELRSNTVFAQDCIKHHLPELTRLLGDANWQGVVKVLKSGATLFEVLAKAGDRVEQSQLAAGSAALMATPVFWLILGASFLTTAINTLIIIVGAIITASL